MGCNILSSKLMSFLGIIRKSGNMVFGIKNVKESVIKDKIKAVLIPTDVSENTLDQLLSLLKHKPNIKIIYINLSKEDLNNSIGKYVSIVGVKHENMICKLEYLISQEHEEECIVCQKNTEYTK